jgi:hypothetical protein
MTQVLELTVVEDFVDYIYKEIGGSAKSSKTVGRLTREALTPMLNTSAIATGADVS